MIGSQEPWVNVLGNAVYLADVHTAVLGDKTCGKLDENASQHFCVLKSTVMVKLAQSKMLCHHIKLVLFKLGDIKGVGQASYVKNKVSLTAVSVLESEGHYLDGHITTVSIVEKWNSMP